MYIKRTTHRDYGGSLGWLLSNSLIATCWKKKFLLSLSSLYLPRGQKMYIFFYVCRVPTSNFSTRRLALFVNDVQKTFIKSYFFFKKKETSSRLTSLKGLINKNLRKYLTWGSWASFRRTKKNQKRTPLIQPKRRNT